MHYDVLVLGSGPAGFYCALSCAGLGQKTILVEKDRLGGTGFRWGCLPVKMMLDRIRAIEAAGASISAEAVLAHTASRMREVEARISRRLKSAGVEVVEGEGRFTDPGSFRLDNRTISADCIVIATGTEPAGWPGVPLDKKRYISHREVLGLSAAPAHLLILGGDVEGIEFACIFSRLGAAVTVIEQEKRILSGTDPDLVEPLRRDLLARGVSLRTGIAVHEAGRSKSHSVRVELQDGSYLEGDMGLITGLRRPNLPEGLDRAGVEHDGQKISVDAGLHTTGAGIYAVGDINGITGLAHAAIRQALLVARRFAASGQRAGAGMSGRLDSESGGIPGADPPFPRAIYALPEIAGAGHQEIELRAAGIPYSGRVYQLADTWRGFSKGIEEGFVKILAGTAGEILGIWICGAAASEQASLFGVLLAGRPTIGDLRDGLILHPTLGEAFLEAALDFDSA